jgi:hypothetical protein
MKNKKNTRKIGNDKCKEVKEILENMGHVTDGPFDKVIWFNKRMGKVHHDIFGIGDLISLSSGGQLFLHQVTALNLKSKKEKKIRTLGAKCLLWIYDSDNKGGDFKIFGVSPKETVELKIEEGEFIKK